MSSNTNIGNTPVNQGYVQLIHTGETGGIDGTLRTLYDGDGTASDLQIASNKVKISTELFIGSDTLQEYIQDTVGAMLVTNASHTNLSAAYDDAGDGAIDLTASGDVTLSNSVTLSNKTLAAPTLTGTTQGASITLSGDLTVNGTTTTVNQTNLDVSDNIIGLNRGAGSNANDSGLIIERGSTGDNAAIIWDESADKFTLGTTTSTPSATGDLTISTGTLVANVEGNVSGNLTTDSVTISTIQTGSESFADNDTSLMTSAAIQDKITSYGYVTSSGISHDGSTANGVLTFKDSDEATVESSLTFNGSVLELKATSAGRSIEVGSGATGDITSFVDLIGDTTYSDYGARFIRFGGANATTDFRHRGTGDFRLIAQDSAAISLQTGSTERLRISSAGDVDIKATKKLYLDGGSDTYIQESSDDELKIFVGNQEMMKFTEGADDRVTIGSTSHLKIQDSKALILGDSDDLVIQHNATNSIIDNHTGDLIIQNDATDKDVILKSDDGSDGMTAYITLDGSSTFTHLHQSTGLAEGKKLFLDGGSDTYITSDSSDLVQYFVGNTEMMRMTEDSTDYVMIPDNVRLSVGTGNDLQLSHNATNSYIQNYTGNLYFQNHTTDGDVHFLVDDGGGNDITAMKIDASEVARVQFQNDNQVVAIGASDDLQFYHDATDSYMLNLTGDLVISNTADDKDISFRSDDGSGGVTEYFKLAGDATIITTSVNNRFDDSKKLLMGGGSDLHMYHDGTDSYLINYTGNLYLQQNADDKDIILQSDDGSGGNTAYLTLDGSGTLINIAQHMDFNDDVRARFGASGDLQIVHTGNINYIHSTVSDRDIYFRVNDGGTNLNSIIIDGSEIGRVKLPNDNQYLSIGASGDLYFYHDGSNSLIRNATGNLHIRVDADDSDLILESDDGSGGVTAYLTLDGSAERIQFSKKAYILDNVKFEFGDGADFQIFHDGSNTDLTNATGDLKFTQYANDADIRFFNDDGSGGTTEYFRLDGGATSIDLLQDTRLAATKKLYLDGGGDTYLYENTGDSVFMHVGGLDMMRWYETSSTGYVYTLDNVRLGVGSGIDFTIRHDGSHTYLVNSTGDMIFREQDSGNINFTNVSGTSRLYINSSGNVGIGTSSPAYKLHLEQAGGVMQQLKATDSAQSYMKFVNSTTGDGQFSDGFLFGLDSDETIAIWNYEATAMRFATSGAEKMRIDSSGNVGIGTTSPNMKLNISHGDQDGLRFNCTSTTGEAFIDFGDSGDNDAGSIRYDHNDNSMKFRVNASERVRIVNTGAFHVTNDVVAFSSTPSDKKLKTNVKDIEYGLDTIMKLKPKQYDWKKDDRHDIGFIAQEVEEVIPEIVKDNEWFDDKIKTMDYEKLTAVLIKAVQEQQQQIEELKNG